MTAPSAAKSALRARLLAARRAVPDDVHAAEASALAGWLTGLSGTVCCYVPVGSEPGSVSMLDVLVGARCTVLLPVVVGAAPLDWVAYRGPDALVKAGLGLLEPIGPRLGAEAIGAASTVLVPALAVARSGVRLGRGGGHYDRTLPLAAGAELVAVVRDCEVVDSLPSEPHDIPMTAALTPTTGLVPLPA